MSLPLGTDFGEEYIVGRNPDGDTLTLLLFNNATDDIQESDDLAAITTEPDDANDYDRQSSTVSTAQLDGTGTGDFGLETDTEVTFNTGTNTEDIDAIGFVATFESTVAGDTDPQDHLLGADTLGTTLDLDQIDEITFAAGDLEIPVSGSA